MTGKSVHLTFIISAFLLVINSCVGQQSSGHTKSLDGRNVAYMDSFVQGQLDFAVKQYKIFMQNIPKDKMPETYDFKKKKVVTCETDWWTVGFYPGALWYLYEESGEKSFKDEAEKRLKLIEYNKDSKNTHDLGFMMYCSFGNGYRLNKDPSYKETLLISASSLSSRFNSTVGCIKSWDTDIWNFPVIIDNMMNLELLLWASKISGDAKYREEAISHANVTLKNHFREDYSSYHVVDYDSISGRVLRKKTWQGYSDSSAWARGQGWGLYGYTMMFRETGDTVYLRQAERIADFILSNPNLPDDKIPYWDFNDPKIPNINRDVSAAAIIASALLELSRYSTSATRYLGVAKEMMINLSSPHYRSDLGETGGFLLKHSVGNLPGGGEVDVPLIYADYYFIEALKRYKDWYWEDDTNTRK